jgi:hypothetical protein
VTILVFVVWVAVWRKAKSEHADISTVWTADETDAEPSKTTVDASEKETTIVDDSPKLVVPPSLVMTDANIVSVGPIENPWENCKTIECSPNPIEKIVLKPIVKKERKPRKSQLERVEDSIAKLEGQIGRRSTLLKQLKKPVTKDERLNKWKVSLKELKSTKKELLKASKPTKAKKAK